MTIELACFPRQNSCFADDSGSFIRSVCIMMAYPGALYITSANVQLVPKRLASRRKQETYW